MTVVNVKKETTASGMRNNHVITNPTETPIAPLDSAIRRICKKMVFTIVLGLAPKALMIPSSLC